LVAVQVLCWMARILALSSAMTHVTMLLLLLLLLLLQPPLSLRYAARSVLDGRAGRSHLP
jgi:ABC-type transport system involved in cytochrome bd biosynthesis fused ATPase/permease subunit